MSWVKPIYFEDETIEWLNSKRDWPPSLLRDLWQINQHNKKYEAIILGKD